MSESSPAVAAPFDQGQPSTPAMSVDDRLAERDVLGIVTKRRFDRQKWEETRYAKKKRFNEQVANRVATLLAQGPLFEKTVRNLVDERMKAEVDRIIAFRLEQSAKEVAVLNRIKGPPLKKILEVVTQVTGIAVGELCGPCRMRCYAWPRHFAFHIIKRARPDLSTTAIGQAFGGRDHTTVMHGLKKVALLADRPPFSEWLMHPAIHALLSWKEDER